MLTFPFLFPFGLRIESGLVSFPFSAALFIKDAWCWNEVESATRGMKNVVLPPHERQTAAEEVKHEIAKRFILQQSSKETHSVRIHLAEYYSQNFCRNSSAIFGWATNLTPVLLTEQLCGMTSQEKPRTSIFLFNNWWTQYKALASHNFSRYQQKPLIYTSVNPQRGTE